MSTETKMEANLWERFTDKLSSMSEGVVNFLGRLFASQISNHMADSMLVLGFRVAGWAVATALLALLFALIYYWGPDLKNKKWRWLTPGAAIGIVGWIVASAVGTFVLAFIVGPAIWRLAKEHNFYTLGDYLDYRYNRNFRGLISLMMAIGTVAIFAGQLMGIAWISGIINASE